jgi:hypothetical protein
MRDPSLNIAWIEFELDHWPFNVSVERTEEEKWTQTQICETYGCTALAEDFCIHCRACNEQIADMYLADPSTFAYEPEQEAVDWENRS